MQNFQTLEEGDFSSSSSSSCCCCLSLPCAECGQDEVLSISMSLPPSETRPSAPQDLARPTWRQAFAFRMMMMGGLLCLCVVCAAVVMGPAGARRIWYDAGSLLHVFRWESWPVPSPYLEPEDYSHAVWNSVVDQPDGQACVTALECGRGKYCAFPALHNMSLRICCDDARNLGFDGVVGHATGSSREDVAAFNADPWLTVCTGAAVGEACGSHHDLCATGKCIRGKCAPRGLPDLASCPDDVHCQSGACGFMEFPVLPNASDQPANSRKRNTVKQQCCPSGRAVRLFPYETGLSYLASACTETAGMGEPCGGHDAVCGAGLVCDARASTCTTTPTKGDSEAMASVTEVTIEDMDATSS